MPSLCQFIRFCSTKTKKDLKTKRAVIRLHWENLQLFGPIIQSTTLRREKPHWDTEETNHGGSRVPGKRAEISDVATFPLTNAWRPLDSKREYPNSILDLNVNAKANSSYPSVSAILSKTMPPESQRALEKWKKLMIEKLGEEGFNMHQKQVLEQGKFFHANVEEVLKGAPYDSVTVDPANWGHWKSLATIFSRITRASVLENWVMHPFLNYKGIIDCVAMYRNEVVLIEWKTSSKLKSKIEYTYDNPLQVAAYMGALNYDPNYKFQLTKGVLVIAYESGAPAQVFVMNKEMCLEYWSKWLNRIQLFNTMSATETNVTNSEQIASAANEH